MIPQIRILDNHLINKIAAGEVVERPAAVVKELVENSIDAKATSITIEIKNGGTILIRVTDNGIGIPEEQLKIAFLRHATSKITDINSLENVLTLGFRGEALSSIAEVAQVEALSKTRDSDIGSKIIIHGGIFMETGKAVCADGTSLAIKNLFFNTPARRKFLKSTAQESAYITEIVNRIALSHPEIAIKYINNSSLILQTNGSGDMKNVVFDVYGKDAAAKMIPIFSEKDGFTISGFLCKPEFSRSNRQYCNFFINKRFVKNKVIQAAAEEAYKTRIQIGRFPAFALNLKLPPKFIDVNVHPAKLEVRFSDDAKISQFISESLKEVFMKEVLIANPIQDVDTRKVPMSNRDDTVNITKPSIAKPSIIESSTVKPATVKPVNYMSQTSISEILPPVIKSSSLLVAENKGGTYESLSLKDTKPVKYEYKQNTVDKMSPSSHFKKSSSVYVSEDEGITYEPLINAENVKKSEKNESEQLFHNYKIIGQAFATYWIIEQDNSIYIMDQHAAHERILYESLCEKLKKSEPVMQELVAPIVVKLSPLEMATVSENLMLLKELGFDLEIFGEDAYVLRTVPYIFENPAKISYFNDIIEILMNNGTGDLAYSEKKDAIAMISCKSAIKANDRISIVEANALIEKILKMENPFTCPHGRPVIIEMTKNDIEKMFKRT